MTKVAINGLGRIGRATLKILMDQPDLDLVAVNDIADPDDLCYLLRYDSVYGRYHQPVKAGGETLRVGDRKITVLSRKEPKDLPWKDLGVDLVFESTGVFRQPEHLKAHRKAGASKVILSAPAKGDGVVTVAPGVNAADAAEQDIASCASCTTNCVAPVAEIMLRRIGFSSCQFTTTHAYTSSQSIVDAPQKKRRRGRAAAANLVPTTTGAADATTLLLPELKGRIDGIAVRCPVPSGSVTDLVFRTDRETTEKEIRDVFSEEAGSDRYRGILGVTDDELVSSDIIGDPRASIVDFGMTRVVQGDLVKILSWYDNEWGYAAQLVRLARIMLGLQPPGDERGKVNVSTSARGAQLARA